MRKPTGIEILPYDAGIIALFDTHYVEAREALRTTMSRLARATPLNDARRRVRALETQLKSHRYLDKMAEDHGWTYTSFVPALLTELAEAQRVLAELEG